MSTYLKVAIGLETMRIFVSRFAAIKQSPLQLPLIFCRNLNWRIVAFLVGYAGAYRVEYLRLTFNLIHIFILNYLQTINCSLNRHFMTSSLAQHRLASFVSAASYYLYPNRTVLAHAIVSALRLAWCRVTDAKATAWCPPPSLSSLLAQLGTVHWSYFFHMFGVAYLFHLRTFYPFWSPSMLMKTTSYLSGYK